MGFFGWLKDKLIDAAVIVTAPITVPLITAGYGAYKAGKALGLISDDVGQTAALSETSSVAQVEDISKAVRKYYNDYKPIGEAKEEAAKKNIDVFFDALKNNLQEKSQLAESFGMDRLNRKKYNLCIDIEGTITDAIKTKLSLDNSECREILSMQAGKEKSRKMKEFAERTINTANKNLEYKIRKAMNEVTNDITIFLQDTVDDQERKARRKQNEFDSWTRDIENKTFDREKAQLPALEKLYAIEQIEKILAA